MRKMNGRKDSMMYLKELNMSLQRLCFELDTPELYEKYMMRNENLFDEKYLIDDSNEKE